MKSFKDRILNYSLDQKIILLTAIAMFMPFYLGIGLLVVDMFYLVYKNKFKEIFDKSNLTVFSMGFAGYSLLLSIINKNTYGILASVGIFVLFVFVLFLRKNMTENFMEDLMTIIMIFASFCFIVTLFQYSWILKNSGFNYSRFMKNISESRWAMTMFFFNVNYYATVCSLVGIICAYKYFTKKSLERAFAFFVGILSVVTLFMTDSRGAMLACFLAVFALTIMMKKKKYYIGISVVSILAIIAIVVSGNMGILPRVDKLGFDLGLRKSIWVSAIEAFKKDLFVGVGPLGIHHIYTSIRSRNILHAHNLILDILVNYGLIGLGLLIPILSQVFVEIKNLYKKAYTKMVIAMVIMVMIHSMVDVTIFWTQTAFIFLTFAVGIGEFSTVSEREVSLVKKLSFSNGKTVYDKIK